MTAYVQIARYVPLVQGVEDDGISIY